MPTTESSPATPMRVGITLFATDRSVGVVELARAAEDRGYDSFWLPEHTHIPTSRITPPPTGEDELPEEYRRTLDPLIGLAACATATETIRLGTGILLPAQREPIVTAKAVATLDHLSDGRVDLGVGFGWNVDEMQHHGIDPARRRGVAREHVLAMRTLWEHDEASFAGEHVQFDPSWSYPKPVQSRVPVLVGGGAGPVLLGHVVEYGDGWIPIGGAGLSDAIPTLRHRCEDAGRDPAGLRIVPFGSLPTPAKLEHFAAIGVTEVVFRVPSVSRDEALRDLDALTDVWRTFVGDDG